MKVELNILYDLDLSNSPTFEALLVLKKNQIKQ